MSEAKRVAFLIGNQMFPLESGLPQLQGPANDVKALARLLGDPERGRFEVREFFDKPHYEVLPEIEQQLSGAAPDDLFLIYYSGHGKLDRNGRLCLATANTRQGALLATSIPGRHLTELVEHSDCDQVVLLLDCCFSGAVGVRGDVESELRVVERARGFYILTASDALQAAREEELVTGGHVMGRFTSALVGGLETGAADLAHKGEICLSDLRRYLERMVTGQTPKFFAGNASGDPLISFSPGTAMALLDVDVLADLNAAQWHRRRGAVSALAGMLRDRDVAVREAARAALLGRLEQERDYEVLSDLRLALCRENVAPGALPPPPSHAQTITPSETKAATSTRLPVRRSPDEVSPSEMGSRIQSVPDDVEVQVQAMVLAGRAPPAEWCPFVSALNFGSMQVSDLSPLAGLTALQSLDLSGTKVRDLSPLAGLTALQSLDLSGTKVGNLSPLAGLTALQGLNLTYTVVSDLSPLVSLAALQSLHLKETLVSDLSPLADLTVLRRLDLSFTQVTDLSPLTGLTALQRLNLRVMQVSDLSPLADLTALQSLDLFGTDISDLSPLAGLTALQSLDLSGGMRDVDLSPLAGLAALQSLDLSGTNVSDLSPLAGLTALQSLDLSGTKVSDLSPLAGLIALQSLNLFGTNVSDLSPLAGLSALHELYDRRGRHSTAESVARSIHSARKQNLHNS